LEENRKGRNRMTSRKAIRLEIAIHTIIVNLWFKSSMQMTKKNNKMEQDRYYDSIIIMMKKDGIVVSIELEVCA